MRQLLLLASFILIFTSSLTVSGQGDSKSMVWIQGTESVRFSDRVSALLLVQHRFYIEDPALNQQILWLSGTYQIHPNLKVGAGLIYFQAHKALSDGFHYIPEIRPFQFLTFGGKSETISWALRSMVEERFQSEVVDTRIYPAENFNMRYRFRMRMNAKLGNKWTLEASNEYFINGGDVQKRFSQNRAVARWHYKLGQWKVHAGYMHWTVQTSKSIENRPTALVGFGHSLDFR